MNGPLLCADMQRLDRMGGSLAQGADGAATRRRLVWDPPLLIAGGIILAAFGALVWCLDEIGDTPFMVAMGLAAAGYVGALARLACGAGVSSRTLLVCLLMALAMRGALLTVPSGPDGDAIRYIWDARVQRAGLDPYRSPPADPALDWLHTATTRAVDAPRLPTIYPPVAQLYFRAVTFFHESIWAFRMAAVICDALIALTVLAALGATGRPPAWVLVYTWHPLVALEGAAGAHVDYAGVLALAVSYFALIRRRTGVATVAFAAAVLIKPLPLVLAPLFWRRVRLRDVMIAAAIAAAAVLVVTAGRPPIGSFGAFVDRFRFNAPLFQLLDQLVHPRLVAALAVIVGLIVAAGFRARSPADAAAAWAWPMAAALLLAPVIYPWYLVWLTPFLASAVSLPLLAWTLSVLVTYRVWHLAVLESPWAVPGPLLAVEFGLVVAAAAWLAVSRWIGKRTA
jgi:alpha-1,6-mannosyltransferase